MKANESNSPGHSRSKFIRSLVTLDSISQSSLDTIAELVAECLETPIGFVSLVDQEHCRYLSAFGMDRHHVSLKQSLCSIAVNSDSPTVVSDVQSDLRAADLMIAELKQPVAFYAAIPFEVAEVTIGMIGGMDFTARKTTGISKAKLAKLDRLKCIVQSVLSALQKSNSAEQSAAALVALYQKTPVMAHSIDENGIIVRVSDRWCEHFGYRREEVIGRKSIEFLTDDSKQYAVSLALPQLRKNKSISDASFQWRRKNGELRDILLSAIVDSDQLGNEITVAVLTDATDLLQQEQLLEQQSEELGNTRERLETAIVGSDIGMWDWNVRDDDVYFSPVWHTQVGEPPGSLSGFEAWQSRIHPDDLAAAMLRVQNCFDGAETEYESTFRFRHANGSYRTILSRGKKFVDENAKPRRLIGIHIDITDRQQNEDRLAIELKRNLDFLRILKKGLAVKSLDELMDWLPFELREMVGTHQSCVSIARQGDWPNAIHANSLSQKYSEFDLAIPAPEIAGPIKEVCQTNHPVLLTETEIEPYPDWRVTTQDGPDPTEHQRPPLRGWMGVPLMSSDGSNLGLLQVSDKIAGDFGIEDQQLVAQFGYIMSLCTERLIAQEEERERSMQLEVALIETEFQAQTLAKSNKELEQFAYVASHDLRSPLRGISNLTQWITEDARQSGTGLSQQVTAHLEMLGNQVNRMDNVLVGLLAYSRAGREKFETEQVDIHELLTGVVSLAGVSTKFTINIPKRKSIVVPTQRSPLERVLLNLITNAVKHHDQTTGTIDIEYREMPNQVLKFWVSDDGPGISPEFHEQVFEAYRTLEDDPTMASHGMGLAIVKKLVDAAGGNISITDNESNRGTQFVFTWPLPTI